MWIEECSDFFIVRNCTLYNSGNADYDSGVFLSHSNNGTITNNTCYDCRTGIRLENCKNITISENRMYNNTYGIYSYLSHNDTISNNNVSNNTNGIYSHLSHNNTISNNNVSKNIEYGIYATDSNYSIILNNTLNENYVSIVIVNCNETQILNNTINGFIRLGIHVWFGHNNTVLSNTIRNPHLRLIYNSLPSIIIERTLNNTVKYNKIINVTLGIRLFRANFTIVRFNVIYHWAIEGCVEQWDCNNLTNIVRNNTCEYLGYQPGGDDEDEGGGDEEHEDVDWFHLKVKLKLDLDVPEEKEENSSFFLTVIFSAIGVSAIVSGLSIYYFRKIRPIKIMKFNRDIVKSKEIIEKALGKEKILRILDKDNFLDETSPLNLLDLTILSEDFLKIIEKFGFEDEDKIEFIKEMLGYSLEERNEFIKNMLKDLNLDQ